LDENVENVFKLLKEIDPRYRIYPKLHHLLHYSHQIKLFGPLINYSTLPHERKHRTFKQRAKIMCNFQNPVKTLAEQHQMKFVLSAQQQQFLLDFDFFESDASDNNAELLASLPQQAKIIRCDKRKFRLNRGILILKD
jgi:hypothetical protein